MSVSIDNTVSYGILVASQAITRDYLNGIHNMSNSIETTIPAQSDDSVLLLKTLATAAKKGEGARAAEKKALDMLQEQGFISTDLTSPKSKKSTCSQEQWAKWRAVVVTAMNETDKKLIGYTDTDGLSKEQIARRKDRQRHIGRQIGWWSTSLAKREEKANESLEGEPAKVTYETRLHDKLSTVLKQLESKEEFSGDIVSLQKSIKLSLTHIKLK